MKNRRWLKKKAQTLLISSVKNVRLDVKWEKSQIISGDLLRQALFTVCRVCSEGVLWILLVGCGLRVGLGEAELARDEAGMLSCSMLLERPPFTSLPTLLRPMEEKKRRRKSFGLPSSFLYVEYQKFIFLMV